MSRIGAKKRADGQRPKANAGSAGASTSKIRSSAAASRQTGPAKKATGSQTSHGKAGKTRAMTAASKPRHQVRERDDVVRAQIDRRLQGAREPSAAAPKVLAQERPSRRQPGPSMQATIKSLEGLTH